MSEHAAHFEAIPPIPPKVATAIAEVMGSVPKLKRGEKNSHGDYNFASIDDFLEAVRPLCATSGLIILQDEDGFEMKTGTDKYGKPKNWLVMTFRFTLAHASGETWGHRPTRTIMVDGSMGSQAFGAAQSYALKQFERSLFQIATGDKTDADFHPADDLPERNGGHGKARSPYTAAPRKRTQAEISAIAKDKRDLYEAALEDLPQIDNLAALDRYKREFLTPEKMAAAGVGQYMIEELVAKREAELSAPAEDEPEAPTRHQADTYLECVAWLGKATTPEDLTKRAKDKEYQRGTAVLTEAQRNDLRGYYTDRMSELQSAPHGRDKAGRPLDLVADAG